MNHGLVASALVRLARPKPVRFRSKFFVEHRGALLRRSSRSYRSRFLKNISLNCIQSKAPYRCVKNRYHRVVPAVERNGRTKFAMIETFLNNVQGVTLDCLQGHVGNDCPTKTLPYKLVLEARAPPAVSTKLSSSSVAAAMREKKFTWNASVESDSRSSASGSHRPDLKRYRPDDRSGKTWTSERERSEARLIGNELREIAHRLFRFELATGAECSSKRLRESVAAIRINRSAQPRNHTESPHDDLDEEPDLVEPEPQSSSKSPQLTTKARFPSVSIPCPSMGSSPPPELFELRWEPLSPQQETSFPAGTAQEDSDFLSWYCA